MAEMDAQVLTLGVNDLTDHEDPAFTCSYVCGGKTFQVLVTDNPPPGYDRDAAEVGWIDQLIELSMHDGADRDKLEAQRFFSQGLAADIRAIVLPTLLELAPPRAGSPPPRNPFAGPHTVREDLYPDVVKLQLVSRGGNFELIPGHDAERSLDEPEPVTSDELQRLGIEEVTSLPTYSDSEVLLLSRLEGGANAYDATIGGGAETAVCKLASDWFRRAFLRELEVLAKIRKVQKNLDTRIRVSVLKGISHPRFASWLGY